MLDPALLRPGRFDRIIEIPLPDEKGRLEILKIHSRRMTLDPDVDLEVISQLTERTTGADLQAICREAGMNAVRRSASSVSREDFTVAVQRVRSESTVPDNRMYI